MSELIVEDIGSNERIKFIYLGIKPNNKSSLLRIRVLNLHDFYVLKYLQEIT